MPMPKPDAGERSVRAMEIVAAVAVLLLTAIVLYIVFGYRPF
jgi:hypothetical protein